MFFRDFEIQFWNLAVKEFLIFVFSDPSFKWSCASELEAKSARSPGGIWCQTGTRGALFGHHGTEELLPQRHAGRGLPRSKGPTISGME